VFEGTELNGKQESGAFGDVRAYLSYQYCVQGEFD